MKFGQPDFEALKKRLDGVALASILAKGGISYEDALKIHGDFPQVDLVYAVKKISDDAGPYGIEASGIEYRLIERVSDASRMLLDGLKAQDLPIAELSDAYLKILDDAAGDYSSQIEWATKGVLLESKFDVFRPALRIANATESILEPQRLAKIFGEIQKGMNAKDLKLELMKHPHLDDSVFYAKKSAGVS